MHREAAEQLFDQIPFRLLELDGALEFPAAFKRAPGFDEVDFGDFLLWLLLLQFNQAFFIGLFEL